MDTPSYSYQLQVRHLKIYSQFHKKMKEKIKRINIFCSETLYPIDLKNISKFILQPLLTNTSISL